MTARFLAGVILGVLLFFVVLSMLGCASVTVTVGNDNVHESDKGIIIKPKEKSK